MAHPLKVQPAKKSGLISFLIFLVFLLWVTSMLRWLEFMNNPDRSLLDFMVKTIWCLTGSSAFFIGVGIYGIWHHRKVKLQLVFLSISIMFLGCWTGTIGVGALAIQYRIPIDTDLFVVISRFFGLLGFIFLVFTAMIAGWRREQQ